MTSSLPTLLVLADGTEPQLRMLEPYRDRVRIVIGPTLASVADAAPASAKSMAAPCPVMVRHSYGLKNACHHFVVA